MFFSAGATRGRSVDRLTNDVSRLSSTRASTITANSASARSQSLLTESLSGDELLADGTAAGVGLQQTNVFQATANVVAEVMGAGLLAVPHAFAILGWFCGLSTVVIFSLLSAYTGVLLIRCKTDFFPGSESYADLAHHVVGPRFGVYTAVFIVVQWAAYLPYWLIAIVSSLKEALPTWKLCFVEWLGLAAVAMLLPIQLQTFHSISFFATASTLSMLTAATILLATLASDDALDAATASGLFSGGDGLSDVVGHSDVVGLSGASGVNASISGFDGMGDGVATSVDPSLDSDFSVGGQSLASTATSLWPPALVSGSPLSATAVLDLVSATCLILFAYLGQSMYLEIAREMAVPAHFARVSILANLIMSSIYVTVASISYHKRGGSVEGFLPDSLPDGVPKRLVGAFLAFHLCVCYLVSAQPFHRALHTWLYPNDASLRKASGAPTPSSPLPWLGLTSITLLVATIAAAAIPFFDQFQSLLAAVTGAPCLFFFPPFFLLRGAKIRGVALSVLDKIVCRFCMWVLFPLVLVLGTAAAVEGIIREWRKGGGAGPFAGC